MLEQSRGHTYSRRGRLVSVRKYKQTTGMAPATSQVATAISRSGKRKDVVKVYDHADPFQLVLFGQGGHLSRHEEGTGPGECLIEGGSSGEPIRGNHCDAGRVGPKGGHATVSKMVALEAQKAGAVPVSTPAGRSGQAAPAQSALDVAMAAQEARYRVA